MKRFTSGIVLLFIVNLMAFFPQHSNAINPSESPKKIEITQMFQVLYQYEPVSKITALQIFVNAGQKQEPSGFQGISYLSTWLSIGLPNRGKINHLMKLGSTFSWQVDGDFAVITVKSLTENLDETMELLSSVLKNPLVSNLRISEIKKQMEFALEILEDDSHLAMKFSLMNSFFKTPGYGGSVYGTKDTQKNIKRKHVLNFLSEHFTLKNMVFSVATDLEEEKLKKMFSRHFKDFPVGRPVKTVSIKTEIPEIKEIVIKRETDEVLLAYGFPVPAVSNKKDYCLAMMLEILTGIGVGSRLWEIREDKNLAYTAESELMRMKDAGILALYVKTSPKQLNQAALALEDIIKKLRESGITKDELDVTKEYSKGELMRHTETKHSRSLYIALFESYGLGYDFIVKIFDRIDSVTLREMNDFITATFNPAHQVKVIIGPDSK